MKQFSAPDFLPNEKAHPEPTLNGGGPLLATLTGIYGQIPDG